MAAVFPDNEEQRIASLQGLSILDTPPEPHYDDLALPASEMCGAPVAPITLIDRERQWFKSRIGLDVQETPRELAFCGHAILAPRHLMVAEDAQQDARSQDNARVTGEPHMRFYAGVPIVLDAGAARRPGFLHRQDRRARTVPPGLGDDG